MPRHRLDWGPFTIIGSIFNLKTYKKYYRIICKEIIINTLATFYIALIFIFYLTLNNIDMILVICLKNRQVLINLAHEVLMTSIWWLLLQGTNCPYAKCSCVHQIVDFIWVTPQQRSSQCAHWLAYIEAKVTERFLLNPIVDYLHLVRIYIHQFWTTWLEWCIEGFIWQRYSF